MKKIKKAQYTYIVTFLFILVVLLFVLLYKFFIGSVTIRTNSEDYSNFEGFLGYSNLEVFPSNPNEISEVSDYYYSCIDTFMDPTCKIYMTCSFSNNEMFERECSRLSQLTVKKESEINKIRYSETLFKYPAYVAMYDWSSCYEYALILEEENKIVYVFLQGSSQKVDKEYMPLKINNESMKFSMYSFDGFFDLKYR